MFLAAQYGRLCSNWAALPVISWNAGPVGKSDSLLSAERKRGGGSCQGWSTALQSTPAWGCPGQQPGGYTEHEACQRAGAREEPVEGFDAVIVSLLF